MYEKSDHEKLQFPKLSCIKCKTSFFGPYSIAISSKVVTSHHILASSTKSCRKDPHPPKNPQWPTFILARVAGVIRIFVCGIFDQEPSLRTAPALESQVWSQTQISSVGFSHLRISEKRVFFANTQLRQSFLIKSWDPHSDHAQTWRCHCISEVMEAKTEARLLTLEG